MLHVGDVARSLRFYALLGFDTIDTEGEGGHLGWARMHCEGGALMFLAAEERMDPSQQGVLLYMYTPDLPALRAHLLANGVEVSPIRYPEYMSSGEIHVRDPDGYAVLVGHWGKPEHEAWEKRLAAKGTKR
jgi:catechol 2,3-dioxygenase-like lactoylglutathione lyase family enzyme